MTSLPPDGLHRDVPAPIYHAWPLPSSTLLNEMWKHSPAHAMRRRSEPLNTDSLRIGTAVHLLVLEGEDAFLSRFAVGGPVNPKTNKPYGSDTDKFAEWAAEMRQAGRECIFTTEADSVRGMARSIAEHPAAYAHLEASSADRELSGIFRPFGDSKLRCKFRLDGYAESFAAIVDLKTTQSANYWDLRRTVPQYGYHRQAALYLRGARACGLEAEHFVFLWVEKEPPHAVAVSELDLPDIEAGERQVEELLRRWDECDERGEWPGYDEECFTLSLAQWVREETYAQRSGTLDIGGMW